MSVQTSLSDESPPPRHSLPLYSEPTPETHRRISREKEAELALLHTAFTPATRPLLITLFLITLASVPLFQLTVELRRREQLSAFALLKPLPAWRAIKSARTLADVWRLLPRANQIKAAEKNVEQESIAAQWLLPRVQLALSALEAGNEQVYPGRDRWLFYRPDIDYVTAPPFLDAARMRQRIRSAAVQPDAIKAIVDFRHRLANRGIDLILMPAPAKPTIDAERFAAPSHSGIAIHNTSFAKFTARLAAAGVRVFDPTPSLMKRKAALGGAPLYLQTDTHWRPETMEFVAKKLADFIGEERSALGLVTQTSRKEITALGDIALMLKLPPEQTLYHAENVTIHQVIRGNTSWQPSPDAEILLLGDSFANIFSLERMGWGDCAGFAEHLSTALRQPLDCILRNNDGAFATREILEHELARGRDRLAGKKLVIWEFAARELAFGDWKLLEMNLARSRPAQFFVPPPHEIITVTGTVEAVSAAPRPGTVPYKDHIIALHLVDISAAGETAANLQALVYLWSMRDNQWTSAARLRAGDRITLKLRSWAEVSSEYEKFNRTELDDAALQLEEPVWGELVPIANGDS
jgi:SGNH hydrolase-like domain, acetyltransferase AlgX